METYRILTFRKENSLYSIRISIEHNERFTVIMSALFFSQALPLFRSGRRVSLSIGSQLPQGQIFESVLHRHPSFPATMARLIYGLFPPLFFGHNVSPGGRVLAWNCVGDPETSASRASRFFSKTWYSTTCCQDSRFVSSPKARWTNCKHTLIHWPDERWAGEVGVLSKVTTTKTSVPDG